ncbi:hypothetical protein KCP73_10970 [Salmonella enterica subsp. enterica]|nr:hypothetical protein KCP73_10970 [Salmonella enterica subsp. enterica]
MRHRLLLFIKLSCSSSMTQCQIFKRRSGGKRVAVLSPLRRFLSPRTLAVVWRNALPAARVQTLRAKRAIVCGVRPISAPCQRLMFAGAGRLAF